MDCGAERVVHERVVGGEVYRGHKEEVGEEREGGQEAVGEDGQTGEGVDGVVGIPAVQPPTG